MLKIFKNPVKSLILKHKNRKNWEKKYGKLQIDSQKSKKVREITNWQIKNDGKFSYILYFNLRHFEHFKAQKK